MVIKRFDYAPWRQWLGSLVRLHPAQRERRSNRRLRQAGLPVVPIIDHGTTDHWWFGGRHWLATPYAGRSLQELVRSGQLNDRVQRLAALRTTADLMINVIRHRFYFRDLKPSNILLDRDGRAWIIDVADARRSQQQIHVLKMLAVMRRKAHGDGVSRSDQLRFLRIIVDHYPDAGNLNTIVSEIDRLNRPSKQVASQPESSPRPVSGR